MWSLEKLPNGKMVRKPTALVDLYKRYSAMPTAESVGELQSAVADRRVRAVLAPAARGRD